MSIKWDDNRKTLRVEVDEAMDEAMADGAPCTPNTRANSCAGHIGHTSFAFSSPRRSCAGFLMSRTVPARNPRGLEEGEALVSKKPAQDLRG